MPKGDGRDLARVLATKAAGDEAAVDGLWQDSNVPNEVLGFHAQQAVEKRIKSVLAERSVVFERTHNLAYLLALLADHEVPPPPHAEDLIALTPWATGFRYEDVSDEVIDRAGVRELVHGVRAWAEQAGWHAE